MDTRKRRTMECATVTTRNLVNLCDCIQNGDVESLRRQLSGCSTNINLILQSKGVGILHLAVGTDPEETSAQCTELLLKHGADPNLCSDDGMTPVHVAAIWGRLENLRLLVACGGNPSLPDDYGMTAFHYAQIEQQDNVIQYFMRNFPNEYQEKMRIGEENEDTSRFSMQLEGVLVSTGHLVAEYGTVSDDRLQSIASCRKSDMIREWCEETSKVNQLYPTILNQTYRILDETRPWRPGDFTNQTFVIPANSNEITKTSYITCRSSAETKISGVEKLEDTRSEENAECNCFCHSDTSLLDAHKRISVYENFSLPGSPNIIHQNYNSKTSIRKKKCNSSNKSVFRCKKKCNKSKKKSPKSRSPDSFDLKKISNAIAIVQNQTNEWLSQSNSSNDSDEMTMDESDVSVAERSLIEADTRRTSGRSSGVNSVESSGSIALASVRELYKYEDKEEDVVLIETRLLVPTVVVPIEEEASRDASPEESRQSIASSLPASIDYDVHRLRAELTARGFTPGPITSATKRLYLRKLKSLKKNVDVPATPKGKTYSIELQRSLRDENWFQDLTRYMELEDKVRRDFTAPRVWREGTAKTCFTYLLLDPRLTHNLPVKANSQSKQDTWNTFVESIFYVGKGKRSRPYSHLYQALTLWKRDFTTSKDKKMQHILDIWRSQAGVICLHVFQNIIPAEAYTYEAAMIDVIGLANLENLKNGNYYGVAAGWAAKERRMLGLYLLYKAMLIFLSEGERQLRPGDIG